MYGICVYLHGVCIFMHVELCVCVHMCVYVYEGHGLTLGVFFNCSHSFFVYF